MATQELNKLEKDSHLPPSITPSNTKFSELVMKESGENINLCYQCQKCSAGCPISFAMDILPHHIIRMVQLGLEEKVLQSKTIWLCSACETCGTRCPNDIDIAKVNDTLKQKAEKSGLSLGEKNAPLFHSAFVSSIKKRGRVYELGMIQEYTLKCGDFAEKFKAGDFLRDAKLGLKMFIRRKLKLYPQKIKGVNEVKKLFKQT
ncbi:MAG: 4Fe-4S dicluster domain-containing protein [Thermodesulfobacteriota bacterium]|nr:4Fe-4S dicluster domain-containing protein [Thermodesulfobacteriota bacterium]